MNSFIQSVNGWSNQWAQAMVAVLWQSTALVVLVAGLCWILRWQSPRVRYWIWLVLSLKLLALPLWSVEAPLPAWLAAGDVGVVGTPTLASPLVRQPVEQFAAEAAASAADRIAAANDSHPTAAASPTPAWYEAASAPTWGLVAWLAVVLAEIARAGWQFLQLKRLLAVTSPVDAAVESLVAQCARTIGLRSVPAVRSAVGEGSPLVCGVFRPTLVLPKRLAAEIDQAALRQIVLHELAHIKRRDLVTVWIIHAMRTAYWFHPAAHWIAYRAGLDRELACDQAAMIHSGATASRYARTLIDAAGRVAQPMAHNAVITARLDVG